MKSLQSFQRVYWLLVALFLIQVANSVFKFYNNFYYLRLYQLLALGILALVLGLLAGVNRWLVFFLGLLGLSFVLLQFWIIWN